MTQITDIQQQILDEITIDDRGHGVISENGLAKLIAVPQQTINSNRNRGCQIAEILTLHGFNPYCKPFPGYPDIVVGPIIYYYAVEARKTSPTAKLLVKTFASIGARAWMQNLKGWNGTDIPEHPTLALPPADVRVSNLINALDKIGFEFDNPRFKADIQDLAGDILGLTPVHSLQPATSRWCGVVERAEQLGYPVGIVTRKRVALGKYVKKHYQGEVRQEKRLCNGTHREINLYEIGVSLDRLIMAYLGSPTSCAIDETSIRD